MQPCGIVQPQVLQPQVGMLLHPQLHGFVLPQPQVRRQLQRQQLQRQQLQPQPQVEPVEGFVAVVLTPATAAVVLVVELPLLRQQGLQQDCPTKFGKMIPPYTLQELHIAEKPPKKDVTEQGAP